MTQWLRIPEAAKKMGCCERQARRRLIAIQARHPHRELLRDYRSSGAAQSKRAGRYLVNPDVMLELVTQENDETLDELTDRVGSLESYQQVIKIRLRALEKQTRSGIDAEKIADLESRLRTLEDLGGHG